MTEQPAADRPAETPTAEQLEQHQRESWKAQRQAREHDAKMQHHQMLDQRAHLRATTGQHWASRKAR